MDIVAETLCEANPSVVFTWVDDLSRYPEWHEIVDRVVALGETDEGPAWSVDLRTRLGPFARSKRLRMVRTLWTPPSAVAFERREVDGRTHSPWVLTAEVESPADAECLDDDRVRSRLIMRLHYGGGLLGRPLELILRSEIDRSRDRLAAKLAGD